MQLSGWGRYPSSESRLIEPATQGVVSEQLAALRAQSSCLISRGAGRSYGDAALAPVVLTSKHLDNFIALESNQDGSATLRCAAGATLDEILRLIVPRGFFLPVLPGTAHVSVGGAIAADIHGKNHHLDGCFSEHVESLTLLLADGSIRECNRDKDRPLFEATCGGMGLTGIVLDATLRLTRIAGPLINNRTRIANSLQECLELFAEHAAAPYSVAWIDCLSSGQHLGRSVLFLGEHSQVVPDKKRDRSRRTISVPFTTPGWLLNKHTMNVFNTLYFKRQKMRSEANLMHYQQYFFPLDAIANWNRLYGKNGFIQYQLVLPEMSAAQGLTQILKKVSEAGKGSFLAVLKQLSAANNNPLSFPLAGYTLTLDFKMEKSLLPLLNELDAILTDHGGRLYLAKDARMSEATFKAGYPRWEEFMEIKAAVDPDNLFTSKLAERLGLSA